MSCLNKGGSGGGANRGYLSYVCKRAHTPQGRRVFVYEGEWESAKYPQSKCLHERKQTHTKGLCYRGVGEMT